MLHGSGESVLVVEDNIPLRRVVLRQLGELGYCAVEAESALAALDIIARDPIDLLLTDIVMPGGIDGIELAHRARDIRPQVRVVFTTGFAERRVNGAAWSPGEGEHLLIKPYRKEDLAQIIRVKLDGAADGNRV